MVGGLKTDCTRRGIDVCCVTIGHDAVTCGERKVTLTVTDTKDNDSVPGCQERARTRNPEPVAKRCDAAELST